MLSKGSEGNQSAQWKFSADDVLKSTAALKLCRCEANWVRTVFSRNLPTPGIASSCLCMQFVVVFRRRSRRKTASSSHLVRRQWHVGVGRVCIQLRACREDGKVTARAFKVLKHLSSTGHDANLCQICQVLRQTHSTKMRRSLVRIDTYSPS